MDETAKSSALSIRCLHGESNGDLWIGYAGAGVGRLRNGQITRFSTEQGLPNDYVAQILTDNRGSVWFAGNQGIFQVRERDFDDVANGLAARVWPIIYGRSEGCRDCRQVLIFIRIHFNLRTINCFFPCCQDWPRCNPIRPRLNYLAPGVFIERVTDDEQTFATYQDIALLTNKSVSMKSNNRSNDKSELRLPPGLPQVQFEFTALSFVASDNVQFRYQLEGLDKNWMDAGTARAASYTHPPPGHYRFKVIACNNDGIWNKVGDSLSVVFEPYFWQTLWFRLTMILSSFGISCGLVVLVLRRRHRTEVERLKHQQALELERNRIARDLHDDLGVGLTEIGLLGDLASTSSELPPASLERLREIIGRTRTLAASLDEIVWAINPTNDTSQSLMEYFFPYAQKLLGSAAIRCRLEVIEPLPVGTLNSEERHEFFHAYKEALNNIIRHSGATQVQVSMAAATERSLLIRIADNGRGLEDADGRGAHHGLSGMRERLLLVWAGGAEIAGSAGSGTTITFIIPVQSET